MIKNIVLDFGHGGIDASGRYTTAPNNMFIHADGYAAYEGQLNRQIGGLVEMFLHWHRPQVNIVSTVDPFDSRDLSLAWRVRVANQYKASETIFVSIHANASPSRAGRGFEIFTTRGTTKSDRLATLIGESVQRYYNEVNLKLRFDFGRDGDLDKEVDFYVLRKTRCPAVLLECLFFDNVEDIKFLRNPQFHKELAWHIYLGIMAYVQET
ncbi:MAG: N-acetylmuramoyl-L-alanine amidase [Bacteroidota bacterium]